MLGKLLVLIDNQLIILILFLKILYYNLRFCNGFLQLFNFISTIRIGSLIGFDMLLQVFDDDFASANLIFSDAPLIRNPPDARIQVIASQNQDTDNPDPEHKDDKCADGAIERIITREIGDVEVKTNRGKDEQSGGHNRAWTEEDEITVFFAT